jgi:hypothetical protein
LKAALPCDFKHLPRPVAVYAETAAHPPVSRLFGSARHRCTKPRANKAPHRPTCHAAPAQGREYAYLTIVHLTQVVDSIGFTHPFNYPEQLPGTPSDSASPRMRT